jgi:hypothetical protein
LAGFELLIVDQLQFVGVLRVFFVRESLSARSRATSDTKLEASAMGRAAEFAYNGTFFDSPYVPYIGYERDLGTFTVIVDQSPTRAGIDPYSKLIDRISDDDMIDLTQR